MHPTLRPLCILLLAIAALRPAAALEPPPAGELARMRADGSLPAALERARGYGDHRVKPWMAARTLQKLGGPAMRTPLPAWKGLPTTGTNRLLVFLIDFPDAPALGTAASVSNQLFGAGDAGNYPLESLQSFYARSSYGQLRLEGDVLGWYRMAHERSWYTNTYGDGNLANCRVVEEVANHFDPDIDYSRYDNNGDGTIDYLCVIWAGAHGAWSSFWWGYQWDLYALSINLDGVAFDGFSWQWESYYYPSGGFEPSTIIHETGHGLGLPDYYDYDGSVGPNGGLGGMDQMDANYCDHNAFSKFMLDWLTPIPVVSNRYALALRAESEFPDAATCSTSYTGGTPYAEYYLFENRHPTLNDQDIPGDGLVIWHVDARSDGNDFLYDNSYTDHKLLRLMEADGLEQIEAGGNTDAGDFFTPPKTFNPYTVPAARTYAGSNAWLFAQNLSSPGATLTLDLLTDPVSVLGFESPTSAVSEGVGTCPLRVVRLWGTGSVASVDFATAAGSAAAGSDFAMTTGSLAFAAGAGACTVAVSVVNDTAEEPDEQFSVLLRNPGTGVIVAVTSAVVTILADPADDITPPQLTRVLVLDSNDVRLTFSEPVVAASALERTNYQTAAGVIAPGLATNRTMVGLALAGLGAATQSLQVAGLRDAVGNTLGGATTNLAYPDPLLQLWLRMDDAAGTAAADASGRGHPGTLSNGPVWTAGHSGGGLQFDEVDDQLTVADFSYGPAFTLSFWFRCSDNSGTYFQYVVSHGSAVQAPGSFFVYIGEDSHSLLADTIRTSVLDADDPTDDTTLGSLDTRLTNFPDDVWHLYTLTLAGGDGARVYVDGALRVQNAALGGAAFNPSGALYFGSRSYSFADRYFGGLLDDARIYDRALAAEEVAALWNAGPSAQIAQPAPGSVWLTGEPVSLSGSGSDPEGGPLRYVWCESTNGVIATGAAATGRLLAAGSRTLTLAAFDELAAPAVASQPLLVLADANTNGLPDAWESAQWPLGGSGGGAGDPDGDGFSNFDEWLAGTEPTNRASAFAFDRVAGATGAVDVGWAARGGRGYRLLESTNPAAAFSEVFSARAGADGRMDWTSAAPDTVRCYKLRVER